MVIFPNAKINIGLWVTSLRDDGFHNIESVFYPIGLKDACEFVVNDSGNDSDEFTQTGINTDCPMNQNLVIKALNLLRSKYNIPSLRMHLHKAIPMGAGLGGGSSDASFVLRYLNRYFELGLETEDLKLLAEELGSDCPFFIDNKVSLARGRGEILTELDNVLCGMHIIIVNPGIHINTAEAYSGLKPKKRDNSLQEFYSLPIDTWRDNIENDFEASVFQSHPEIKEIKKELYKQGALYSSMTGSGSSVYGIFTEKPPQIMLSRYWSWIGILSF